MNNCVIIFLFLLGFSQNILSKTAEERTLSSLRYAIEIYKAEKKVLPKDWESIKSFGFETTLEEAGELLDVKNRYIFPDIKKTFESSTSPEKRIVLMAKRSGKEGDLKVYEDSNNFRSIEGRFVIFELVGDGRIESGRISEEVLRSMFKSEGLNLADFTFEEPPKTESKSYRLPDSIRRPGDSAHLWERKTIRPDRKMKDISSDDSASDQADLLRQWIYLVCGGVIFCVIFFVIKRINLTR